MQNNALSGNPSGFGLFVQGALGDGIQGGGLAQVHCPRLGGLQWPPPPPKDFIIFSAFRPQALMETLLQPTSQAVQSNQGSIRRSRRYLFVCMHGFRNDRFHLFSVQSIT